MNNFFLDAAEHRDNILLSSCIDMIKTLPFSKWDV